MLTCKCADRSVGEPSGACASLWNAPLLVSNVWLVLVCRVVVCCLIAFVGGCRLELFANAFVVVSMCVFRCVVVLFVFRLLALYLLKGMVAFCMVCVFVAVL